jgi:hypothetical protein
MIVPESDANLGIRPARRQAAGPNAVLRKTGSVAGRAG